jgi:octaprenyl-diphosphate synthase
MNIKEVWDYYSEDLELAEKKIAASLIPVEPVISEVGKHIFSGGGKRIRPILVILCSKISGYSGDKIGILASSIESIHTASLLHDDVVDGAKLRRGRPPAHSLWGNQIAVLAGDYFYSNALRLANSLENQKIMNALSSATAKMAEKELKQLLLKKNPDTSEKEYMEIITGKTATLMSATSVSGALLGNVSKEKVAALESFGLKLGMAFQIADDILDYMADENALGKNLGKDLEEGKITLPLIYLLKKTSNSETARVKEIINSEIISETDLVYIQTLLSRYRSIEQSYEKAGAIKKEADAELEIFEDSIEKKALLSLSSYALSRNK